MNNKFLKNLKVDIWLLFIQSNADTFEFLFQQNALNITFAGVQHDYHQVSCSRYSNNLQN